MRTAYPTLPRGAVLAAAICLAAAACLFPGRSNGVTKYTLTDLGTLGGNESWAYSINDYGQVVGSTRGPTGHHAFLWENGTMVNLGSLNGRTTIAYGINNAGEVVGISYVTSSNYHAFYWNGGTMADLGTLGGASSFANSINDGGQIVGWAYTAAGQTHACVWEEGAARDLGERAAWAINNAGFIVGTRNLRACLWRPDGTTVDLGTLGGSSSDASAINELVQVVGVADNAAGYGRPFLWENGKRRDLGTPGYDYGYALGINDHGQVVGSVGTGVGVLWEGGVMYDLGRQVVGGYYEITMAYAINNRGQIVGTYLQGGDPHAYLLTPIPEPGMVALVGLALIGTLLAGRRKRS